MEQNPNPSLLHYKFTLGSGFIVTLLFLALLALGERILYDLARIFVGGSYNYFDDLSTILVHSFFILPILVISIVVNVVVGERKQKYAIALIPYFLLTIILSLQLALQVSVYFYNHHTEIQFYIVISLLVLITSVAIYAIQSRYRAQ